MSPLNSKHFTTILKNYKRKEHLYVQQNSLFNLNSAPNPIGKHITFSATNVFTFQFPSVRLYFLTTGGKCHINRIEFRTTTDPTHTQIRTLSTAEPPASISYYLFISSLYEYVLLLGFFFYYLPNAFWNILNRAVFQYYEGIAEMESFSCGRFINMKYRLIFCNNVFTGGDALGERGYKS